MPTSHEFRELNVDADAVDESTAPSQVIGRDELVQALWVQVKSGSTRLSAPRRVGKTWFLNLALAMRPEWAGPTLFNAAECRSLREFVWELTRHLHMHGYVPESWEVEVRHWYTQRPCSESVMDGASLQSEAEWEEVLLKTCGILVEKGPADCPVLMIDELPTFLETLVGEWAEEEAGRLLEALHGLRVRYPALRMILSDAQGLQQVLDKLRRGGYQGRPLDDLPPFELPALTAADAGYLAGCLLLGEQVSCTDIHAVAGAIADACGNIPSAIRNTVDWMARFGEGPWSPDRVRELPTTHDMDNEDRSDPALLEEHLSLFGPEDVVHGEGSAPVAVATQTDRIANRGFASLFPFSMDALSNEVTLGGRPGNGAKREEMESRSIVAGPLADGFPGHHLDPSNRSFDWLDATLSPPHRKVVMDVRTALARSMQSGNSCHIMLAGPAGSGKSHTLAVLAKGFAKGLGLSGRPRKVIYLPGAEHSAESPFDLLLTCMLADGRPNERLRGRLDAAAPDDRFGVLESAFRERFGGQCTLIAIENVGTNIQDWNKTAQETLRGFLDRHPSVVLLGTAGPEPLDTGRFQGWLKERLRICSMPELNKEAVGELLHALASARGDETLATALREPRQAGIIRAFHALSGGNCRVLHSLDRCLSVKGLRAIEGPMLQMTRGDLAPAYERRLGERPPQQYKILQALAEHQGRAVNVTELSRYMFLTPQAVSRQLQELLRAGFLLRTQVGREICYELSEPLIRFVLDFKHGRDSSLPLLARVVQRWCEVDRLYRSELDGFPFAEAFRYEGLVEVTYEACAPSDTPAAVVALNPDADPQGESQSDRTISRQLTMDSPELRSPVLEPQVIALAGETDTGLGVLFRVAGLLTKGRNQEGLATLDDWLRSAEAAKAASEYAIVAQTMRVYTLLVLTRFEGAVAAADSVLVAVGDTSCASARECRAMTQINKGIALLKLGRFEDAAAVYDEFVQETDPVEFPEMTAAALLNRAAALERLGRFAEAIAALDLVSEQFGRAVHGNQRETAATAQVAKAVLLERLGQHEDALQACTYALRIRPGHARGLVMRALSLCRKEREDEVFLAVEAALGATEPGQSERALLAAGLFDRLAGMETTAQVAAAIFGRDRESLLNGLMLWARDRIASPDPDARRMDWRLYTLRAIFDDDPEAALVLTLADSMARTARGDARAILDLPIELRRLMMKNTG